MCQFHATSSSFFFNSKFLYTSTEVTFVKLEEYHLSASLALLSPDIVF